MRECGHKVRSTQGQTAINRLRDRRDHRTRIRKCEFGLHKEFFRKMRDHMRAYRGYHYRATYGYSIKEV